MDFDRISLQSGGVRLFERPGSDIRMTGYLKKLKTMKKKYFVLRSTSSSGPARLEYYDSEKKYSAGQLPKRCIHLHTCFNINRKSDSRHKNTIALYTKEECFSVICEDEKEQENWLLQMLEYQNEFVNDGERNREHYDYVWQVTIQPKGLGQTMNLRGPYRLCMTKQDVRLVKLNMDKPQYVFQLETVRSLVRSDNVFGMKVGKIAPTGEGELWMQTDNSSIAHSLHDTILNSMQNLDRRPDFPENRRCDSLSLHGSSSSLARPSEFRHRSETFTQGSCRTRPRIERPTSMHTATARSTSHLHSAVSPGTSPNPHALGFLDHHILGSHRMRSDSMESRASKTSMSAISDDLMHEMHILSMMEPALEEESFFDKDLSLEQQAGVSSLGTHWQDQDVNDGQGEDYMEMTPGNATPPSTDTSGYIDMTPVNQKDSKDGWSEAGSAYIPMNPSWSSSAPIPILSGHHSHSSHGEHGTGYLDMAAHSPLPPVKEGGSNEGYLPMSPSYNASSVGSSSSSQLRPDRVVCMLSDDGSDFSQPPTRTYSLGSRPVKTGTAVHSGYIDMSGRKGMSDNGRSCSAPHLINHHPHHHRNSGRTNNLDSPTPSASPLSMSLKSDDSDSFMEFDFYRPRTASDSYSYRPRASSFGMPQSSLAQGHRPRSSSHGQGTRPIRRHKMLDPSGRLNHDMLLRSQNSSHGSVDSLKVSSCESLKKLSQEMRTKASQLDSAGYVDMSFEKRHTPSPQPGSAAGNRAVQEGYVDMTLGNRKQSPDLSGLSSRASSKKNNSEKAVESDYTNMSLGAGANASDSAYINYDSNKGKSKKDSPPRVSSAENVDEYMMYEPATTPTNTSKKEATPRGDSSSPDPRSRAGSGGKELKKRGFFSLRSGPADLGKHGSKKGDASQQSGVGPSYSATGGEKFGSLGRDIRQKSKDLSKAVARKSSSFSKTFGINTTKPGKQIRKTPTPPKCLDGNDEYIEFTPTSVKSDSDSSHASGNVKASRSGHEVTSATEEAVYVGFEPANMPASSSFSAQRNASAPISSSSSYVPMNAGSQGAVFKPVKKSGTKKSKSKEETGQAYQGLPSSAPLPQHVDVSQSQSALPHPLPGRERQLNTSPSSKAQSGQVTSLVKPVPVYPSGSGQVSASRHAAPEDRSGLKSLCPSAPNSSHMSSVHTSETPVDKDRSLQAYPQHSSSSLATIIPAPSLYETGQGSGNPSSLAGLTVKSCQPSALSCQPSDSLSVKMCNSKQSSDNEYVEYDPGQPVTGSSSVNPNDTISSVVLPVVVRSYIADDRTASTPSQESAAIPSVKVSSSCVTPVPTSVERDSPEQSQATVRDSQSLPSATSFPGATSLNTQSTMLNSRITGKSFGENKTGNSAGCAPEGCREDTTSEQSSSVSGPPDHGQCDSQSKDVSDVCISRNGESSSESSSQQTLPQPGSGPSVEIPGSTHNSCGGNSSGAGIEQPRTGDQSRGGSSTVTTQATCHTDDVAGHCTADLGGCGEMMIPGVAVSQQHPSQRLAEDQQQDPLAGPHQSSRSDRQDMGIPGLQGCAVLDMVPADRVSDSGEAPSGSKTCHSSSPSSERNPLFPYATMDNSASKDARITL